MANESLTTRYFIRFLKFVGFLGVLYLLFFQTPLKHYVLPPLWNWLLEIVETFFYVLWYTFLVCSILLAFLMWWLRWGDAKMKRRVSNYISKLVSPDYYKESKHYDFEKAVYTATSKYDAQRLDAEGLQQDAAGIAAKQLEEQLKERESQEQSLINNEEFEDLDLTDTSDGVRRSYYENGNIKKEVGFKDGNIEGAYRLYYEDGTLRQEKHYQHGKLNGVFRAYDDLGVLYFEINYKDGKQHGIEKTYHRNGNIQYEDTYVEGRKINRKTYNEAGELKSNYNFHQK